MPLKTLAAFPAQISTKSIVQNNQDIPTGEMDIFYQTEAEFLPEGKTFADLTEDEIDSKFNSIKWNKKCTNSNKR